MQKDTSRKMGVTAKSLGISLSPASGAKPTDAGTKASVKTEPVKTGASQGIMPQSLK